MNDTIEKEGRKEGQINKYINKITELTNKVKEGRK